MTNEQNRIEKAKEKKTSRDSHFRLRTMTERLCTANTFFLPCISLFTYVVPNGNGWLCSNCSYSFEIALSYSKMARPHACNQNNRLCPIVCRVGGLNWIRPYSRFIDSELSLISYLSWLRWNVKVHMRDACFNDVICVRVVLNAYIGRE